MTSIFFNRVGSTTNLNRTIVFQPAFFTGYVSFRGSFSIGGLGPGGSAWDSNHQPACVFVGGSWEVGWLKKLWSGSGSTEPAGVFVPGYQAANTPKEWMNGAIPV